MRAVLALNAGSSTLKFALYDAEGLGLLARGLIDHWGSDAQAVSVRDGAGRLLLGAEIPDAPDDREASIRFLFEWVRQRWPDADLAAVGHRIVHGGDYAGPVRVTPEVLGKLEALTLLAPLHQPWGLCGLKMATEVCPHAPQVASFDTAFHRTMPPVASRFALPRNFETEGIRRYGFHGLSYAYISRRLRELDPAVAAGRILVAHLGSGASLCAVRDGRSVDTTMGFSTLDGLVMATRPGSLDPGVLIYLLQARGMTAAEISDMLYNRSGLLGASGLSGDLRALLASAAPVAGEAVELYVHRIVREIGGLAAILGGLDGLVFTGGVGENSASIRAAVCERLAWLGVSITDDLPAPEHLISEPASIPVWVIPTDEERVIASEALLASE